MVQMFYCELSPLLALYLFSSTYVRDIVKLTGGKNNNQIKIAENCCGQLAVGSWHSPLRLQIYLHIISENADRIDYLYGEGSEKEGTGVKWTGHYY